MEARLNKWLNFYSCDSQANRQRDFNQLRLGVATSRQDNPHFQIKGRSLGHKVKQRCGVRIICRPVVALPGTRRCSSSRSGRPRSRRARAAMLGRRSVSVSGRFVKLSRESSSPALVHTLLELEAILGGGDGAFERLVYFTRAAHGAHVDRDETFKLRVIAQRRHFRHPFGRPLVALLLRERNGRLFVERVLGHERELLSPRADPVLELIDQLLEYARRFNPCWLSHNRETSDCDLSPGERTPPPYHSLVRHTVMGEYGLYNVPVISAVVPNQFAFE